MQPSVRRRAWARALLLVAVLGGSLYLLYLLRGILTPLFIAFFIAYLFSPWVDALERRGFTRGRAVVLLLLAAATGLVLAAFILIPLLQEQFRQVAQRVPGYVQELRERGAPFLERLDARYPQLIDSARQKALEWLRDNYPRLLSPATQFFSRMFSSLGNFVLGVLNLVIIPVFAVYILADLNLIRRRATELVPERFRAGVFGYLGQVHEVLRAYIRGQLTVCLVLAVVYSAGLTLSGTPIPLLLGIASGFLNLIPYMGLAVGMTTTVTLSLLEDQSLARVLGVVATFVLGQMLEGFVITPRVVGGKLGLHPLVIMLSVLVGGTLFGFFGILVAVPAAACLAVFARAGLDRYLVSEFYQGTAPLDGSPQASDRSPSASRKARPRKSRAGSAPTGIS